MEEAFILLGLLFLLIALGVPIGFALALATVPSILMEPRLSIIMVVQRTYHSLDTFLLLAVPLFLLAGSLMNETGATQRLIRVAYALVGHIRGGLAHVNVVVSMLFAGISGSSISDTAGVGSVLIPAMKEKGYSSAFSVAITACSSVMGIIIPPSLVMIVWGATTGTSVASLFAGGIIPGLLIGLSQMLLIRILAGVRGYPVEEYRGFNELLSSLRSGSLALLMPIVIIGGIMFGLFTPTEAAIIAVLYALFLGFVYRKIALKELIHVFAETAKMASLPLFCVGTAGIFGWMLAFYRIPIAIAAWGSQFESAEMLLLAICIIFLVLGTFLDGLVIIIIVAPLFMPAIHAADIHPVHYGLVGTVALSFGLVTPPYGLCLLIASRIGNISVQEAMPDTLLLLGAMMIILLALVFVPELTLFIPRLLAGQ